MEDSHRTDKIEETILQGDWLELADDAFSLLPQSLAENQTPLGIRIGFRAFTQKRIASSRWMSCAGFNRRGAQSCPSGKGLWFSFFLNRLFGTNNQVAMSYSRLFYKFVLRAQFV